MYLLEFKEIAMKKSQIWNISKGKLEIIWKVEILSIFIISWKIKHKSISPQLYVRHKFLHILHISFLLTFEHP